MKRRKNKPPTKSAVDYIELLYNKYAPKLKYVAKQYIHNDTLAEDVLQNVFEKALLYSEKILELPDEKAFTFLYVIPLPLLQSSSTSSFFLFLISFFFLHVRSRMLPYQVYLHLLRAPYILI